jgi:hypothetical protein
LLKGETKMVRLEFDANLLQSGVAKLIIAPYANKTSQVVNIHFDK